MTPDSQPSHLHGKNTRREVRELALRMLFELDLGKQPEDEVIRAGLAQSHLDEKHQALTEELVRGTLAHRDQIDTRVAALATDWALDRQAAVDRNILRLASYEMLYRPDSPVAAVVNEAVELAKKYSTAESGRFVNGVLGALARQPRGETEDESGSSESRED
jgi:N utilization substance protein B